MPSPHRSWSAATTGRIREPRAHVCVSAAVAAELRQAYGIEATVIPNGVDAARFGNAERSGWEHLGRYVLAVGGIEPRKGSLDLLRAMALLQARRPELQLVLAGGETLFDHRDYRAAFDSLAADLGLEPCVLGPVADHALPSLVASAAAFAFPSTKEGFGLAAMEALAAEVPVVTRELPVLREVFGGAALFASDCAGLAARLESAVTVTDPARTAVGRAIAARHTWEAAAEAHERWYAHVGPHPQSAHLQR